MRCLSIARAMAFFAFSIILSRVLPGPDISVPETFAAYFQRRRSMPSTTEYSIPLNSIAIAFVCLRESGIRHSSITTTLRAR